LACFNRLEQQPFPTSLYGETTEIGWEVKRNEKQETVRLASDFASYSFDVASFKLNNV
jgi:hypothetical protein